MNMVETYIEYDGKKYRLRELTIERWQNIMKLKDLIDEVDLYIKMISEMTGLTPEQVRLGDAKSIITAGKLLDDFIKQESKEVHFNINHKGIDYELVDFSNITFGQFIDIDSFIMKDESYKISNLNELAAYLYTEKGKKYGEGNFKEKIQSFKDFPLKGVEGGLFFLWTLDGALQGLSEAYSKNKLLWRVMKILIILRSFGDTISGFLNSLKTKFGKFLLLLVSPLLFVSIICRTFWTYIKKKRKR